MLVPKKVKFRKWQTKRSNPKFQSPDTRGIKLSFGSYGLKSTSQARVKSNQIEAARKVIAAVENGEVAPGSLIEATRRLVFNKGTDSHDYKFSSAILEDYYHLAPPWRNRVLAAGMYYLPGSDSPDNALVGRIRAAVGG